MRPYLSSPGSLISRIDASYAEAMSALVHDAVAATPQLAEHPDTARWLAECYSPARCAARLATDTGFGAFIGDALLGTVLVAADGHVRGAYVKADYRGLGIGEKLLRQAVAAGGRSMSADPDGDAMLQLAGKFGFEFDHVDPDRSYYPDRDYLILVRR